MASKENSGGLRRVRVRITGLVQGVFFRAETRRQTRLIGDLNGFVRNLPDGSVEVVAEGPSEAVEKLIDWCRKGPPLARVRSVEVSEEKPTGEKSGFRVAY